METQLNTQMLTNTLKDFIKSTKNSNTEYSIANFNYTDNNKYRLKNGKLALNTCFNANYDFFKFPTTISKLAKDGIYIVTINESGF